MAGYSPPRSLETSDANPMRCSRLMRIQCAAPPQGRVAVLHNGGDKGAIGRTKQNSRIDTTNPGFAPPPGLTETKRLATGNENPTWQARVVYAKMVAGCFRSTAKGTSRAEVPRSMVGTRLFRVSMRGEAAARPWGCPRLVTTVHVRVREPLHCHCATYHCGRECKYSCCSPA
jgi:hypothetical protein